MAKKNARFTVEFNFGRTDKQWEVIDRAIEQVVETLSAIDDAARISPGTSTWPTER